MSLENKYVIFVLGGPGAGKGTQCSLLIEKYPITHLSAGELLRGAMKSGSEDGLMISKIIEEGKIVPSHITVKLLLDAMRADKHQVFLIDGFPRNEENKNVWFECVKNEPIKTSMCICIDTSKEVMAKRILGRSVDSGRSDDNTQSMLKRFDTYDKETCPIIDYFGSIDKLKRFDGSGTPEEVFKEVDQVISTFFKENGIKTE
ncbi:UMP-CMP kinase [Entamoeba marina]